MTPKDKQMWASDKTIDQIIEKRNSYMEDSAEWDEWNLIKAERLENLKPSTKEEIIYFLESDLNKIPEGLSKTSKLPIIVMHQGRRSELEYNPKQRHPIPYVIVKHKKYYFFILREAGSGETRLIGKKGLLGGHVDADDKDELSISKTILKGLRRELEEEAGITQELIRSIELTGLLKSNVGVDSDHLGVIYLIELETRDIVSQEKDKLTGIWLHEKELAEHEDSFESWAKMIYNEWIKPTI